ncbi:MAG TPA: hypothetical protein VM686_04080 [Polyangiaceae bacterium]|nr:hypothetical protein [Polyangiaceae bacterium]
MLKCSAFSAVAVAIAVACAASQPAPSPPAPEPATSDLPPAAIETTSSSRQEAAEPDVKGDTSITKDAGTGIDDTDASADAGAQTASAGACKTDADCVPAQCCHATSCTLKSQAPSCADKMCTKECRGGTMDCGGGCFCQQGKCNAKLGRP